MVGRQIPEDNEPAIVEEDGIVAESRQFSDRRRRIITQRDKRRRERVCWWDGEPADYGDNGVVVRRGQSVPMCQKCYDRLADETLVAEPQPREERGHGIFSTEVVPRPFGSRFRR